MRQTIFHYQNLFDLFMSHRKKSDYFTLILRKKWDCMESKMDLNHMEHFWLFYGTINMKYDHLIISMSILSYFSPSHVRIKNVPLSLMQSVTYGVIKLSLSGIQTFFKICNHTLDNINIDLSVALKWYNC